MTVVEPQAVRTVLVGGDSLLIECGERLLTLGAQIVAVAASSERVADWARAQDLAVVDADRDPGDLHDALAELRFDWLLAITYLDILPESVLALPGKGAINFHDGPLPAYAGLNAPAWALLDGAADYGVSWHLITNGVDEGDLVAHRTFDVAPDETSLSLNTRNFDAALESFDELADALLRDDVRPTPQDPEATRRTFRRADRPAAGQILDWSRGAADLDRLVRALTFGPYPNPLGVAKVWSDQAVLLVTDAELTEGDGPAGRVLAADDERLVIATTDGALALTGLSDLVGNPVAPAEASARLGVDAGDDLPLIDAQVADALTSAVRDAARHERAHLRLLESLSPVELPWAATVPEGRAPEVVTHHLDVADRDDAAVVGAFAVLLGRVSGHAHVDVALAPPGARRGLGEPFDALFAPATPIRLHVDPDAPVESVMEDARRQLSSGAARTTHLSDLIARQPRLSAVPELASGQLLPLAIRLDDAEDLLPGAIAELRRHDAGWSFAYDARALVSDDVATIAEALRTVASVIADAPQTPVADVDLLGPTLRDQVLERWNDTATVVEESCVHDLIHRRAASDPDVVAVEFEGRTLTYSELVDAANRLAHHLQSLGVRPGSLVGVHVDRSLDLVVAVLAVHTAGGGYVPLDPEYPADRLAHMISDSGCEVIITASAVGAPPAASSSSLAIVDLIADREAIDLRPTDRPTADVRPSDIAYCIYTSGSTGLPKGVLIEHRNVVNFFVGMDDVVDHELPATWLAVTSLSFDISVLELLYTLSRGFTVVVYRDRDRSHDAGTTSEWSNTPIDMSLFYFSGDAEEGHGSSKYRLLLEGARFADAHGFRAVWTPERHFHAFGGLYPQPAVSGAAVAAITKNVHIRAGSVVMPLTDPIRVAEAWSIVDNISDGRVGISFASGWQPNDFVLKPENYSIAKQAMFDGIEAVQALWRGETREFPGPLGPVEVSTLPRPVQPELPTWVTTAGNPETYIQAGRIGANILTHLLGQSVEQLGPKLELYRQARAEAGFDPDGGTVTVMLHTFVGTDDETVRSIVREPLKDYLGTSFSLLREYAWSFPAFQRPEGAVDDGLSDDDFKNLSPEELDAVLEFAFDRYVGSSGLFGTPARCVEMVDRLKAIGVGEIACLIDFGVDTDAVLDSLPLLDEVRRLANPSDILGTPDAPEIDTSFAAQVERHRITHLQCTPSMARMLTLHDDSRAALATIGQIFIGGEAFPPALARDLAEIAPSTRVTNMYGPTETTIWSTTWTLTGEEEPIPIGEPIANTRVYVLDERQQPVLPGAPGELWIGGDGVVRGYHARPELTEDRFRPDPFAGGTARMYRTGDLARWVRRDDTAHLEFLGRLDHQVKIRGYRIELGEIETRLGRLPDIRECVAVVQHDRHDEQQLVAFVSCRDGATVDPPRVRDALRTHLPEVMVPAHVIVLDDLPHTPNGKIDRNGLPSFDQVASTRARVEPPAAADDALERDVLEIWQEILGSTDIGVEDNFFDIGGHSLLVVRMHRRLVDRLERDISLTDLYRHPTVRGFASSLRTDTTAEMIQSSVDRAARRKQSLQRRRVRS